VGYGIEQRHRLRSSQTQFGQLDDGLSFRLGTRYSLLLDSFRSGLPFTTGDFVMTSPRGRLSGSSAERVPGVVSVQRGDLFECQMKQ